MATRRDENPLRCSFCGKSQKEVKKLVAGPAGVYICEECIGLCNDIIAAEAAVDDDDEGATVDET